jgi:hypothetical protein
MLSPAMKNLLPKSAYSFVEISDTHWPNTQTVYSCPGKPGKINFSVRTINKDQGGVGIPVEFKQFVQNPQQVQVMYYDFKEEIAKVNNKDLGQSSSYSYKLLTVDVQLFGLQTIVENFAGKKMKSIFMTNYKNLVLDYDKWK